MNQNLFLDKISRYPSCPFMFQNSFKVLKNPPKGPLEYDQDPKPWVRWAFAENIFTLCYNSYLDFKIFIVFHSES